MANKRLWPRASGINNHLTVVWSGGTICRPRTVCTVRIYIYIRKVKKQNKRRNNRLCSYVCVACVCVKEGTKTNNNVRSLASGGGGGVRTYMYIYI